jgi:hypothetical protein
MIRSTDNNPRVSAEMPIDRYGNEKVVVIEFRHDLERIELALDVSDAKALARTISKAARMLS